MRNPVTPPNLNGKLILVAEDELITATDYYFELKKAGATAVGFSPTNQSALDYLAGHDVDAAIVDFMLQEGTGEPLITYLYDHEIPFVVVSPASLSEWAVAFPRPWKNPSLELTYYVPSRKRWVATPHNTRLVMDRCCCCIPYFGPEITLHCAGHASAKCVLCIVTGGVLSPTRHLA
jgi:hypothetical protein